MSNQPMFSDPAHPDLPPHDWEAFKREYPSVWGISRVIDRAYLDLPPDLLPLARGGVVLGDHLLRSLGYQPGRRRPRGWERVNAGLYQHSRKPMEFSALRVVRPLWTILRCNRITSPLGWNWEALVHPCGATPVLTNDVKEVIFFAERYGAGDAPLGFRWAEILPTHFLEAMKYARTRNQIERACGDCHS